MSDMLSKVKEVKTNMDNERQAKDNQNKEQLRNLIIELNNKCDIDKLNEILEIGSYAFKNGILSFGMNYSTEDSKNFIADCILHKIGLHSSYPINNCNFNQVAILGGGVCGNIGVVFQDNTFFITDENANVQNEKSYVLCVENVDKIYECYKDLSVKWVGYFVNSIDNFMLKFESRINNIK